MTPKKTAEEYKEMYFEERFQQVNAKLDDLKELIVLKASTTSVLRLEGRIQQMEISHIPCSTVILVKKQVEDLEKEFKPVKEATDGAVYFTKHPKQLKMVVIGAVFLLIISIISLLPSWFMWRSYNLNLKKAQTEQIHNIPK